MAALKRADLRVGTTDRRWWRNERGAQLVEFALVLPLLLLITCGIFDFGFLFQRYEILTNAAREGARLASLPGYTGDEVKTRVNAYLAASGVSGAVVADPVIESMSAGGSTFNVVRVTVTLTHQHSFVGPMMGLFGSALSSVPLKAVVVMRVESQGS